MYVIWFLCTGHRVRALVPQSILTPSLLPVPAMLRRVNTKRPVTSKRHKPSADESRGIVGVTGLLVLVVAPDSLVSTQRRLGASNAPYQRDVLRTIL